MNDREGWRERGSGISVLMARQDDDDVRLYLHFLCCFLRVFFFAYSYMISSISIKYKSFANRSI